MTTTWTTTFQLALLVGLSGGVGALFRGWFGRKTVRADASARIEETSAHFIDQMREDLDAATDKIRVFQQELWEHRKWDVMVVRKLEALGVDDIPDPPQLWL